MNNNCHIPDLVQESSYVENGSLIKLNMEMRNVSRKQQPDQRAEHS